MFKVEILIFDDGERYPVLMGEDGMPHFYATLWVTTKLRPSQTVNTIVNRLRSVQWLFEWEEYSKRRLSSEFEQGCFLTDEDMTDLKSHMKIDALEYRKVIQNKVNPSRKVVSLHGVPEVITTIASVGRNHHYNRMTATADYLHFLAKVTNQYRNNPSMTKAIDDMFKKFKKMRPKGKGKNVTDDAETKTLPDGLLDEFLDIAHFEHPKNPFKHPAIKKRNHLMFVVMRELGIRRGEMLSLELTHMELNGDRPSIWIKRKHDDKFDSRKNQPTSKTKERKLPIKVKTAHLLDEYILNERSSTPNAQKHPYLFVTHRKCPTQGNPLSTSTFDNIIVQTMKAVDEKFAQIHPHIFRHEWNLDFSRKVDTSNKLAEMGDSSKKTISSEKEAKMRKHFMGHSSEKSGDVYNRRFIKEKANEVVLLEQTELQQKLDELENKKKQESKESNK